MLRRGGTLAALLRSALTTGLEFAHVLEWDPAAKAPPPQQAPNPQLAGHTDTPFCPWPGGRSGSWPARSGKPAAALKPAPARTQACGADSEATLKQLRWSRVHAAALIPVQMHGKPAGP